VDLGIIKTAADGDEDYQGLMNAITQGKPSPPSGSEVNHRIYNELSVEDGILMRGDKIYIPNASDQPGQPNIRSKIVTIAHEGHPGETMMKRYIRLRLWFPKMDKEITVRGCLTCQAATETKHRDPTLHPNPIPTPRGAMAETICRSLGSDSKWNLSPGGHR